MLFKLSNLNTNLALTLVYLNPALNNSALVSKEANATSGCPYLFSLQVKKLFCASQGTDGNWCSSFSFNPQGDVTPEDLQRLFQRNTTLQRCCNLVSNCKNIVSALLP